MNLPAAIRALYPLAEPDDYELRDEGDGAGPCLALWHEAKLGPAPATAVLEAEAAKTPEPEADVPRAKPALVETEEFRAKRR